MKGSGRRVLGALGSLAVLAGASGCLPEDARLVAQRRALAAEHAERMERLERIEARLLAAGAVRAEWAELQRRSNQVTELACTSAAEHVEALARHDERQRDKRRKIRARRIAAARAEREAEVSLTDGPPMQGEGGPVE